VPGRPLLYRTTPAFLRAFHLASIDELPELPDTESEPPGEGLTAEEAALRIAQRFRKSAEERKA
jgi:chromosome segregation and condensation protein ScpB